MASVNTIQRLFADAAIAMYDHDPGATTAIICSPDGGTTKRVLDLSKYDVFAVLASNQVLVGAGITKVEIVAAEDILMATNLTVIKDSGVIATDAMDDYCALECQASEVVQLGANLRYVAARITQANAGDEARVVYIGYKPRLKSNGLTATYIS